MTEQGIISIEGPIEKIGDELVLLIPLDAGGAELRTVTQSISVIEGDVLKILLPAWLANKLKLSEGDFVCVDNSNDKFNISRTDGVVQ